jgi:DNA primase
MTGALYSPEQIERVRREHSLVTMVRKRVELRRAGRRWSGLCPFHGEKTPSFTVGDGTSGEFYHCFGCGAHGDLFDWLEHAEGWSFAQAMQRLIGGEMPDARRPMHAEQRQPSRERSDFVSSTAAGRWIYRTSGPARGEIVEAWLKSRGLDPLAELAPGVAAIDQLRFHPRCPLGVWRIDDDPRDGRDAPAMVAPFADAQGLIRGVHVTWLAPDGKGKAVLPRRRDGQERPGRKMFGRAGGCAVFLTPCGTAKEVGPLVVGEGIETTWSFAQGLGSPCRAVAALSLENLQGHAVRLRGGALPLWGLRADPERPPFLIEEPGEVIVLVDADMKPLRGMQVQDEQGAKPVVRDIGGAERAEICAQLATQFWRRAGATRVERRRPRMGLDFNDAQVESTRVAA